MATLTWDDTTSDMLAGLGGTINNGDTIYFNEGSRAITANVNQSTKTGCTVYVGKNFRGTGGTNAAPIVFGTGTTFIYDGLRCPSWSFQASGTLFKILNTAQFPGAITLVGGTITTLVIGGQSPGVVLSGGTITNLIAAGPGVVAQLAAALAVTNLRANGGARIHASNVPANNYLDDSFLEFLKDSAATATLLRVNGARARALYSGKALTVTLLDVDGGRFDARENPHPLTLTDCNVRAGGVVDLYNGVDNIVATNDPAIYGGIINHHESITPNYVLDKGSGVGSYGSTGGGGSYG